ncbi:MAG: DNA polymerase III subunit alpha, partial [Actinomycetota bacterium]
VERVLDLIRETRDIDVDIDAVPLDDEETYALLQRAETIGVFQLEGGPMRALIRSLAPTEFEDVAALVSLYRPGPMAANMHNDYADRKNGRKPVEYEDPVLEEVLGDTYGLMIYQESVMRVAQRVAGYSLAEADNLRKACGKKIRELIAKEREKFVDGCEQTGFGRELGTRLFDIIEPFADYAFNKSHAYGYGLVAYQTAYLKAHHPTEYLAALLTSVKHDLDKAGIYLAECRNIGIEVLVPDINVSASDFTAVVPDDGGAGAIPFGLSAVRNVGEGLVGHIVAEREENGPFADFVDFCERVDTTVLNKRTVESLIKAGAFDSVGHPRKGLLAVFESIVDQTVARRRERDMGVMTLFGGDDGSEPTFEERPPIPDLEFGKSERLAFEKEMLGLYVSDHPLMGTEVALGRKTDAQLPDLEVLEDGTMRTFGGVVTSLQRKWTKKGDLMAVFTLEDLRASVEVMVFPKVMAEHGHKLEDDLIVCLKARVDHRDDLPKLIASSIEVFQPAADGAPPIRLELGHAALRDDLLIDLKELLAEHPGPSEVFVSLGESKVVRLRDFQVDATNGLVAELRVKLGADAVVI